MDAASHALDHFNGRIKVDIDLSAMGLAPGSLPDALRQRAAAQDLTSLLPMERHGGGMPCKKPISSFLKNLYGMVSDESVPQIQWSGDNSFVVPNTKTFCKNVLPKYFKHNKLSSFVRQLNMYQFTKEQKSTFHWTHPHFKRSDMSSLGRIRRKFVNQEKKLKGRVDDLKKSIQDHQSIIVALQLRIKQLEEHVVRANEYQYLVTEELNELRKTLDPLIAHCPQLGELVDAYPETSTTSQELDNSSETAHQDYQDYGDLEHIDWKEQMHTARKATWPKARTTPLSPLPEDFPTPPPNTC